MKTTILLSPDAPAGSAADGLNSLTKGQLIERLQAAEKTIAHFQAESAQESSDEIVIREKIAVGLSREQAVNVIKCQRAFNDTGIK